MSTGTKQKHYPETISSPIFPEMEVKIQNFWEQNNIFKKSVDNLPKHDAGGNEFSFFDGPPFANGLPHYGHLLTSCVKDIFARYQTMKGRRTERVFGWDCHGLPAEMEVEKELNIHGQHQIEQFGIGKFNDACRTSVMKYTSEWEFYVNRIGRWVDFEHGYKTMDKNYMESVMWAFAELYNKGLVYEGHKVMPYSWAAETPLSNFETRMDNAYREKVSKSAYVAFELVTSDKLSEFSDKKVFLVAWTTTPWTLPSNLALAIGKEVNYVAVEKDSNVYIISKNAVGKLFGEEISQLSALSSQLLLGLKYKPLFPYFENDKRGGKNAFTILEGDFVSDTDGTGIVHIAPGFGEDDQRVAEANGICLPDNGGIICPVDEAGKFTDEIFDIFETRDDVTIPLPFQGERLGEGMDIFFFPARDKEKIFSSINKSASSRNLNALAKASQLRKNQTDFENKLWQELRDRQSDGYKFRRQHSIGNFIVDFVCLETGLVVELDGGQHNLDANIEKDLARTRFLNEQGYSVLRFWNFEISENIEGVWYTISYYQRILTSPHPTSPLRRGEGNSSKKILLTLKGLNVIQDTRKSEDEPYKDDQLKKYGLVNLRIINYLKEAGLLIKQEDYTHNYPHCWRTDTPLIYKAVPSWYVKVTAFKDRMVELNQKINWIPSHVKDGQFGKWLENAHDWAISRNRYWGSPIPVWKSNNPKNKKLYVFGSIKELEEFFGVKVNDLHRPFIDSLTKPDPQDNKFTIKRVTEVLDCWFESGSMPFAELHYPFENKDKFKSRFPADFIVEYTAQTRGWFYTLMVLATALFDEIPFKNCICHGVILGEPTKNPDTGKMEKQKLSKRLKNYPDPINIFDTIGADAMRWMMVSSPVMSGGELTVSKDGADIRDASRLVLKPVWNAYHFFCLYANSDGIKAEEKFETENLMDKYILSKLKETITAIEKSFDEFYTNTACKAVEDFFEVLNNWYIRRSRDRFWSGNKDGDKISAYNTLYTCLVNISKAAAPLAPYLFDEVFKGLTGKESVHLEKFPDVSDKNKDLANDIKLLTLRKSMDKVREICNAGLSIRNKENAKVRQPLASANVIFSDTFTNDLSLYNDIIADELNVKKVNFSYDLGEKAELKLNLNFPVLGKRLPHKVKELIPAVKQGKWKMLDGGEVEVLGEVLEHQEYSLNLEPKNKKGAAAVSSNDVVIELDLNITEELKAEGIARDVVRAIQQARKEADLNITDRINVNLKVPTEFEAAINANTNYISEQTLAKTLNIGNRAYSRFKQNYKLDEADIEISFDVAA